MTQTYSKLFHKALVKKKLILRQQVAREKKISQNRKLIARRVIDDDKNKTWRPDVIKTFL